MSVDTFVALVFVWVVAATVATRLDLLEEAGHDEREVVMSEEMNESTRAGS